MTKGSSLKLIRESKGLTQQDLADSVGLHVQYISDIERGVRVPGMGAARKIRDYFDGAISIDELVPPKKKAA